MRAGIVRVTFVALALLASPALTIVDATAAPVGAASSDAQLSVDVTPELQPGLIDLNATDWIDEWEVSPQADIFMSDNGYVVVTLRNLGSAAGFAVLLDEDVVETRYLETGETDAIYLDDVPLGAVITVTGADVELAQYTAPDENG